MWGRAFAAVLLVAAAAAGACSSFSGGEATSAPDDGGGVPDAIPAVDATAPPSDAAVPFCKSVDATLCDDFDEATELSPDWQVDDVDGGARYAIRSPAASQPNCLSLAGGDVLVPNDAGKCTGGDLQLSRPTAGVAVGAVELWFKVNFDDADGGVNHGDGNIGPSITLGAVNGSHCKFYLSNANGVPVLRFDAPGNPPGVALKPLSSFALTKGQWLDVKLRFDVGAGGTTVTANGTVLQSLPACDAKTLGQVAINANCSKVSTQGNLDDWALWVR